MAIQHSDITNANCHEPLHITASSTSDAGKVITPSSVTSGESELRRIIFEELNIAGSTDGEMKPFGAYFDSTYTSGSPLTIPASTRTKITIDGLDAKTVERGMPSGVTFWDTTTNKMTPEYEDDAYDVRFQFVAALTSASADQHVTAEMDIGGTPGVILTETRPLLKGTGDNNIVLSWPTFCLDTFFANGGELYITPSAEIDLWDVGVYIIRTRKGGAS